METYFPHDPKELRKFNLARYKGIPPSWELIEKVIKKSGLKMLSKFEYVWFMPRSTLTWYKTGEKILPAKYWHIFYDFDLVSQKYRKMYRKRKKGENVTSKSTSVLPFNKQLLNDFQ